MKRETMTSRRRVLAAMNHCEPDRTPMGLGGHSASGISVYAYKRLREYLGLPEKDIYVYQMVQGTSFVDRDVMDRFHLDTVLLTPRWKDPIRWNPRGDFVFQAARSVRPEPCGDGEWIVRRGDAAMRMPKGGFFFDGDWIVENEYDTEEALWRDFSANAERIFHETDYFTMMPYMLDSFAGDIELHCAMYTDPDAVVGRQRNALARSLQNAESIIRHCGRTIQAVTMAGDLGMQTGPMLAPSMYETYCYPYLKELCGFIHRNSDLKVFMHCCGGIEPLIPYMIDAGVDVLNPVQISARGMDPENLKRLYGGKITFWGGGCDTQSMLGGGTPGQIAAHVTSLMDVFKPGGGFVFAQVHNIMGNVPPENIVAMMDAAYEGSFY